MSGVMVLRCSVCGAEVRAEEQQCSNCIEKESKVQVLTPEEKQEFNGVTLVQEQEQGARGHYESEHYHRDQRIYTKQFSVGNTSILTKIIIGLVLLGVVFVALPVAILGISIISLILYFFRK